jgi:hypothetical protein
MAIKEATIITLSSAEAEYVATTSASCQAVWLRRLLGDLQHQTKEPTQIYCDNNSAIALSKNHVFHKKSKHIDTRYHFIHELVNNGLINLKFCGTKEQLAYIFTKSLASNSFVSQKQQLGIRDSHN